MKLYMVRKAPRPKAWQVIAAHRARAIESKSFANDAELEQAYNRATTVTLSSRRAAVAFVERIGGVVVE